MMLDGTIDKAVSVKCKSGVKGGGEIKQ